MQATAPSPSSSGSSLLRSLAWFLLIPVTVFLALSVATAILVSSYQASHQDRIYTGVFAWGVDLSGMLRSEARQALATQFPYSHQTAVTLLDPISGQKWEKTPAELGLAIDVDATLNKAYQVGRGQQATTNLRQQFETWYYGHQLAPVVIFDESKVDAFVAELAGQINVPAQDAALSFDGNEAGFQEGQVGRVLDTGQTRQAIIKTLNSLGTTRVTLPVLAIQPAVQDTSQAATKIQQILSGPISFYLNEPLSEVDLSRAEVSVEQLTSWLRIDAVENSDGSLSHNVYVDENGIRNWLMSFAEQLRREPVRARFYFNDSTRELVLVEPHINGREVDVEATVDRFMERVVTQNRSLPFMLKEIVPTVHSGATAEELGITELVTENTTWFRGSSLERKHNIARAAANFYGIVVAPGEIFSFNQYLGDVSEEEGYETGLIIFGGRTIEGVGGGVCQVSTTMFQSAFWAGFPIEERWAHGYRVGYYDDGEGAGMDATIFSPIVDLQFTNNTPYHLLIENYYNEVNESLTFKFYSTSLGRQVVKGEVSVSNVVPPKPDVWEFNSDLEEGEILQVDWAVEGAEYRVPREVFNAEGELLISEVFESKYIPWQNVYQYGPGVTPPSGSDGEAEP